jgi:hypothetical protein
VPTLALSIICKIEIVLNGRDKFADLILMNCAPEFNSGTGGSGGFSGNSEKSSKPEFNSGTGGSGGFSGSEDQSSKPQFNSGTGGSGGFSGREDQSSKPGATHQRHICCPTMQDKHKLKIRLFSVKV